MWPGENNEEGTASWPHQNSQPQHHQHEVDLTTTHIWKDPDANLCNGAPVNGAVLGGAGGALDEEAHALDLLDVVEGNQADVGLGESPLAVGNLLQDLAGVSAAEHGQLEHCPVPVVVVVLQYDRDRNQIKDSGIGSMKIFHRQTR